MKSQQLEINKLTQIGGEMDVELATKKQSLVDTEKLLDDARMELLGVKSAIMEKDSQIE
jgi:hypothetical protein